MRFLQRYKLTKKARRPSFLISFFFSLSSLSSAEEPCLVERCCSQTSSELSCRGCVDEEIQQIVCEKDVTCCVDKWDRFCAEKYHCLSFVVIAKLTLLFCFVKQRAITYSTRCNTGSSSTSSSSNNSNESNGEDGSETWEQQPDEEESGLSNAEVFGIVFGVLLLFIIVIFLTFTVVVLYIKWRAPVVVRA
ncbi:hypothetical protein QOT17_009311 [Balamuthia mandrillaris]